MRKTKIICTLGPACSSDEMMKQLILNGMDVARFNFSHQTQEEHAQRFEQIDRLRRELNKPVATLLDTRGPEIRLGLIKNKKAELVAGQEFTLTSRQIEGDNTQASITYAGLIDDVRVGTHILIDDGLIDMEVINIQDDSIVCRVINSGTISDRKGINVPDVSLSMPFISRKDREDIIFGAKLGFDFIAASFTRTAADVLEVRKLLDDNGGERVKIIAKIENSEGISNIDEIIQVSDGIMVARGDMGVEIPFENIPSLQKLLIKKGYNAGIPVITATQMLDSMMKNPRPTRAEITDVANAIYDGTSAIMLSGETAAGCYPVDALRVMSAIAEKTESDIDYQKRFWMRTDNERIDITTAISHATVSTSIDLNVEAIITVTKYGATAKMISRYRPLAPIIACSPHEQTVRQLSLSWGVYPILSEEKEDTDELFKHALEVSKNAGYVKAGDTVVSTAGIPLGISGTTNLMRVDVVE